MDYRITDAHADPVAAAGYATEELVRLQSFLCYTAPTDAPAVGQLPVDRVGIVTFVSCNNPAKLQPSVLRLWARILHEVPESRLLLKSKPLADVRVKQMWLRRFDSLGIAAERIDFSGMIPMTGGHLAVYGELSDIMLEAFPYSGTTTTCEALYMGVPVVSLRKPYSHRQNVPASLLHSVGLERLVVDTEDAYVATAVELARDRDTLRQIRSELRTRMQRSPLMDGPGHVRELENLYERMIQRLEEPSSWKGEAQVKTAPREEPRSRPSPSPSRKEQAVGGASPSRRSGRRAQRGAFDTTGEEVSST